jgi:ABC-2 type transport system ATP-binding protein
VALIHAGALAAIGTTAEVKQTFAGRSIAEVRTTDPVQAMTTLDEMPEVEKTSLFGTAVHAVFRQPHLDTSALARSLAAAGIAVISVERVSPSLEDVFLDVVEKAGREAATSSWR